MRIIDLVKEKVNRINLQRKYLLPSPNYNYTDSVKEIKERIINSIPEGLSELEKAYYIYLELGKDLYENPINMFGEREERIGLSNINIGDELHGNCKAIAELYATILKDKRVNIRADLMPINEKQKGSHVDAIIHADGKQYITNLISDVSRIKTARRVNSFGFELLGRENFSYEEKYKARIRKHYKNFDFLTREQREMLDKKLGYSYSPKIERGNNERGLYAEDVFEQVWIELQDSDNFKKYVLKGKEITPEDDVLKYKMQFLIENMDKFSTFNRDMRYLENIRYYFRTLKIFFSPEDAQRIKMYACAKNEDLSQIYSIIKVRSKNKEICENTYFLYDEKEKKYKEVKKEELQDFVKKNKGLKIIGEIDRKQKEKLDIEKGLEL